ncbi:MAG: hypothetical protein MJZ67_01190 [Bacteroidales bacterium]|nr:hypothetical protein [Bacteroidales bacterium]
MNILLYRLLLPRRYRHYLLKANGNKDKCHETILHGTYYEEYDAYDFGHKTPSERREYLTDSVRNKICRKVNDPAQQAIVMDKYRTAEHLRDFYGRKFMMLQTATDRGAFLTFAQECGQVVVKPTQDCAGRGVKLVESTDIGALNALFDSLISAHRPFIVEERIVQDASMAAWNTSVNTIRMNTFQHSGKVEHFTAFLRTGRKGSFVDNGAQGGLFASVDDVSGMIITDGYDEFGHHYAAHPDSQVPYQGVQIPRWDELKNLTTRMALQFPKMTYIGWDLALTPSGWVLVEANIGEYIAQQITLKRGLRKEFEARAYGDATSSLSCS